MLDLRLSQVSVAYNGRRAIDGVSLWVPAQSWVALIGPNGAGKSSLLKSVAGLVGYTGTIEIGGRGTAELDRRLLSRLAAFLPQRPLLPEGMTVADYVAIGRTPHIPYWGTESAEDLEVVATVLSRLGLESLGQRDIDSLSGGETQRVVLARALAQQSQLLLLDEPTSALDVGHQQQVLELIDELRLEQELTVLSSVHDLNLAGQFADRLVLLDEGRVVSEGSAAEVLTEERIERHYRARVRVVATEDSDGLTVIPVRGNRVGVETPDREGR
ncbi:MAG: ABC transporter ATP-binding protein [Acidimicrobiia bacterium]